jgi:hypothetical protein
MSEIADSSLFDPLCVLILECNLANSNPLKVVGLLIRSRRVKVDRSPEFDFNQFTLFVRFGRVQMVHSSPFNSSTRLSLPHASSHSIRRTNLDAGLSNRPQTPFVPSPFNFSVVHKQ